MYMSDDTYEKRCFTLAELSSPCALHGKIRIGSWFFGRMLNEGDLKPSEKGKGNTFIIQ